MSAGVPQASLHPEWFESAVARALLEAQSARLRATLDGVFGEHLLQIGRWGTREGVKPLARTQAATTVYGRGEGGDVAAEFWNLPFATSSVDALVMPHTLDFSERPHDVLREAHRVLRSEGKLVMLAFKPFGFWGLRNFLTPGGYPTGARRLQGERNLKDWLALLNMRVDDYERFFFRLPLRGLGAPISARWESIGRRWWPEFAACQLITARKRFAAMTPLRPSWRTRAQVVGGSVSETGLRPVARLRKGPGDQDPTPS
ncbi:MAG: methyltransferase domain-containing protein [Pseudomonadota bacterium]